MNLFNLALYASVGSYQSEPLPEPNTVNLTTSDFEYTTHDQDEGNFSNRSAFSTLKFSTSGTSIDLGVYTDIDSTAYYDEMKMSIYDSNYNFVDVIEPIKTVQRQDFNVTLPSPGTYYIVEGGGIPEGGADFRSASLVDITGVQMAIETIPLNDNLVVVEGDSISIGDGSTNNSRYAYQMILRKNMPTYDFIADGWGGLTGSNQVGTAQKRADVIARVKAQFDRRNGRKVLLWVLGTNDYGLERDLNDLVADMTTFFNDLITAVPTVEIIIITPLVRVNEDVDNSFGYNLPDLRTAFEGIATNITGVTAYDGSGIVTLADLPDGLHPDNNAHGNKIAPTFETIILNN